jgi:quinoprotein glucose dehydrogenase
LADVGSDLAHAYSPLKQIDTQNEAEATALTYHMNPGGTAPAATPAEGGRGRGGRGGGGGRNWSVTPLVIKGVMYLTTAYNRVVALQPETAKEIWVYEVKDGAPAMRGLEFWAGDKDSPATIFFGTSSGKLFALNAQTGKPIPGFGNEGVVDMKPGALSGLENASFGLSSPPIVLGMSSSPNPCTGGSECGRAGDTRA